MPNFLKEVRVLRDEGKVHTRLISRVRILLAISALLAFITIYNLFLRPADIMLAVGLIALGLVLGLFVFSRMSAVQWNEDASVVSTGRMDMVGFAAIALYIVFEIGLRTILRDTFPASATTLILAGVFGTIFGRAVGTLIEIHRVYRTSHTL